MDFFYVGKKKLFAGLFAPISCCAICCLSEPFQSVKKHFIFLSFNYQNKIFSQNSSSGQLWANMMPLVDKYAHLLFFYICFIKKMFNRPFGIQLFVYGQLCSYCQDIKQQNYDHFPCVSLTYLFPTTLADDLGKVPITAKQKK